MTLFLRRPVGAAFAILCLPLVLAGQAVEPDSDPKPEEAAPQQLDRFVVIGSYIPSTEMAVDAGASPVLRIDRQAIEDSGHTKTAELLQDIAVANANSVPISNNATGFTPAATAVSLRGLGPEATLVLINGRRVAPYPVGAGGTTAFVDLNSIPLSAIDSIEVLKDGASALYGADAVAGVINLKLRRGIDGTEATVSYGNTTDEDSSEVAASIVTGANTPRRSVIAGVNYYRRRGIMHRDREYSAVPPFLSTNSSPFNLEITRFAAADALGQPLNAPIAGVPNNFAFFYAHSGSDAGNNGERGAPGYTYSADRSATFNFNEFAMSYPNNERKGVFVFGEHKLFGTDNVKAYVDLMYQDVRFENQLAPTATGDLATPGRTPVVIPARTANPILAIVVPSLGRVFSVPAGFVAPEGSIPGPGTKIVGGVVQRLAAPGAVNPFNPFNQDISDGSRGRLVEFGNRIVRNRTQAYLFTSGIAAENVAGRWNFDASVSYSAIRDHSRDTRQSATRLNELLNANSAVFNSQDPAYLGATTPYNPFGYYRNPIAGNAALVDYATVTSSSRNRSDLVHVNAVVSTSDLGRLPGGAIGFAFGGDFRREELEQDPDPLARTGDLIGESPKAVTNAQRKIAGAFAEGRFPLLRQLEVSTSVRHERFFTSHRHTTVPKVGLRFLPLDNQLTVRMSYSKGFREPSLYELYSTPISVLSPIQDPRTGATEPEQAVTLRGNRQLAAEKTNYFNAGFVWSPTTPRLKGLTLGVDHWRVTRIGTVEAVPQNTVYRAFGALPGGLFPGESVEQASNGAISGVNSVFFNAGRTEVSGWDFSGSYQLPTDALGLWELSSVWTLITTFDRAAVAGARLTSVLGRDSTGAGDNGYLEWKGRVNLSWSFRGWRVYLSGLYLEGFEDRDANGGVFLVDDSFVAQGQVSYAFRDHRSRWLRDTKVSLGMYNLFDQDPPRALGGGGNSSGYPGHLYTSEGRFWYVSLNRKF